MESTKQYKSCNCPHSRPRRSFLQWLWTACLTLAAVEVGWLGFSIFNASGKRGKERTQDRIIDAGTVDQFKPGQVKAIAQGQFYLSRLEDGRFIALSRVCTHLGCALPWNYEKQAFVCPCHGSTFDRQGLATRPPATRPLDYYRVRIENGVIMVNITTSVGRSGFSSSQTAGV
ncbi:QcrA and Rieske domain-containing protein [Desulfopila aestuarii]|uniref:Cytochrome b6-f complex iron-sulfur subunit n=1 Tax=Desulfopila aestuarii DSM 18488 TaxID=1121416 RepID=A0A1M7YF56_9BACT|nr:Rieske (2Fe-2S) protein [Desulfopila aestuarii]SHO51274.1 cytochrome b6-f complex iron-sulfur subunit [Desulfopila aestuarii DSM 18488]